MEYIKTKNCMKKHIVKTTAELLDITNKYNNKDFVIQLTGNILKIHKKKTTKFLFFSFPSKLLIEIIEIIPSIKDYDYINAYVNYVGQEIMNNKSGNKIILDLLNMCMGNSIEANEVLGLLQKNVFFGVPFEKWKMIDELSDNLFYYVGIMKLIGTNFEEVMEANMVKLKSRYPDGRKNLNVFVNKNKEKEKELIQELIHKNEKNGKSENPEIQ